MPIVIAATGWRRAQTAGGIFGAGAVLVGLGFLLWEFNQQYQSELVYAARVEETVRVIQAARRIPRGHTIMHSDLEVVELPPDYVPNAVLRDAAQAVGRTTREPILAQTFIREERLVDPYAGTQPAALLPRGTRAVRVGLPYARSWPRPGDYVDVSQVRDGSFCLVFESLRVAYVETLEGEIVASAQVDQIVAAYLQVSVADVPDVLEADRPILLLRHPIDMATPPWPLCNPPADVGVRETD